MKKSADGTHIFRVPTADYLLDAFQQLLQMAIQQPVVESCSLLFLM